MTDSVAKQLTAMGHALAHPTKAERLRAVKRKRAPVGEKQTQQVRTEESYYPAFEDLLLKHDCWFFHPTTSHFTRKRRGQKGWVDYTILGIGWLCFAELKATSLTTGRDGRLDPEQRVYKEFIERAGGEHLVWTLPADWPLVEDYLNGKTGKNIRGTWRTA